jgi:hypothetical protein
MEGERSPLVMNRFQQILGCLCGLSLLVSCGSTQYKITLRDGREFMTTSKPQFNAKTGYYKFRGMNSKDALIRADEILMMNEL